MWKKWALLVISEIEVALCEEGMWEKKFSKQDVKMKVIGSWHYVKEVIILCEYWNFCFILSVVKIYYVELYYYIMYIIYTWG
jgi:hypothetical protein